MPTAAGRDANNCRATVACAWSSRISGFSRESELDLFKRNAGFLDERKNQAPSRNPTDCVKITIGAISFIARWESDLSPNTCAAFRAILPFPQKIIHARWSGEACWILLGNFNLGVAAENATSRTKPGEFSFFYSADISEMEILLPCGTARFCSVAEAARRQSPFDYS